MRMIVFEDAAPRLGPLAQTRPVFELRCGCLTLIERQQRCLAADEIGVLVRPELAALCRWAWPNRPVNQPDWGGDESLMLVNGRWLAPESAAVEEAPHVGLVGEQIAYVVVPKGEARELTPQTLPRRLAAWLAALPKRPVGGEMIDHPWHLVEYNAKALSQDEWYWRTHKETGTAGRVTVHGPRERFVASPSARLEPYSFIDTTKGPVLLDDDVVVAAFSRLTGPVYVGPGTQILGGKVIGSSLGPQCRIGGEVEASIVHGFSNKAHDGFLGHSYLGEWVNLGAGTQTSDLRNDYAPVSLTVSGQRIDTRLIKVGSFIGDHTKTSIGTLFNTGSVAGPFGMLVTNGTLMPRNIPAFCVVVDGKMRERTDLGAMFQTAATMMGRRNVAWTQDHADIFLDLYERTSGERQKLLRDTEQRRLRVV